MGTSRRERTTARLATCALELFEARGFENTTVAQIAEAAGVSEMTFFRHFATKEQAILADPYDPAIASAIAAQPPGPALIRAARGVRSALDRIPDEALGNVRRRLRIIRRSAHLRAKSVGTTGASEAAISAQLAADGAGPTVARAAAAAVIAALSTALIEWAESEQEPLSSALDLALRVLEAREEAASEND